mmetsp:Transcript_5128/g.16958  ORF Transcript_5128/g.16958 Transcript_5128/m.16958 type:complete len:226 (+) Transcript_5128:11266-11943(+)|eukprot:scaffold5708_cov107-Isochrysis_galbana.AAC.15
MPVEAGRDVGVELKGLRHLEAERRQLAHLAQEADEPVRVVDLECQIVLVHLHQLALELQAETRPRLTHLRLDLVDPLGEVLLRVIVQVLVQLLRLGLKARHALQVVQQRISRRQHLGRLDLQLPGQYNLVDHLGQVLARRLPALGHSGAVLPRTGLELVPHDVELLEQLTEQRLARRRQLVEDDRLHHQLLGSKELAQQRVPTQARRREPLLQLVRDVALDRLHQ